MDPRTGAAVTWLLSSDEPAIRVLARRDVLGCAGRRGHRPGAGRGKVTALPGQHGDGGFGVHPYRK